MPKKIVQLNEEVIKGQIKELVCGSTVTSPPLPWMSPSRYLSSREFLLKLRSLSGTVVVRAVAEEAFIDMYPACGEQLQKFCGAARCFSHSKVQLVIKMLKAIHAQESKKAVHEKVKAALEELRFMKLKETAKKVEGSIEETLPTATFPASTGLVSALTMSLNG